MLINIDSFSVLLRYSEVMDYWENSTCIGHSQRQSRNRLVSSSPYKSLVPTKLGQSQLRPVDHDAEVAIDNADCSKPHFLCRELALAVIQGLPDLLMD
jgi:hypothetical protein